MGRDRSVVPSARSCHVDREHGSVLSCLMVVAVLWISHSGIRSVAPQAPQAPLVSGENGVKLLECSPLPLHLPLPLLRDDEMYRAPQHFAEASMPAGLA